MAPGFSFFWIIRRIVMRPNEAHVCCRVLGLPHKWLLKIKLLELAGVTNHNGDTIKNTT